MKNWTLLLLALVVATLFSGCKKDDASSLAVTGTRVVKVQVIHPTLGSGPNFLVRGFYTLESLQANRPDVTATTKLDGYAVLKGFNPGLAFVECRIAGSASDTLNPGYFDRDTIQVPQSGDTLRITLRPI
jgi:hypothetical protein